MYTTRPLSVRWSIFARNTESTNSVEIVHCHSRPSSPVKLIPKPDKNREYGPR
jgi:hypothetical protein